LTNPFFLNRLKVRVSQRALCEIKSDKIKANYKDGILKITLPKSEEAKKKEVKIKVE